MRFLFPLFVVASSLSAGIEFFRGSLLSERYWIKGKFERALTRPFYKDYENSIHFKITGFVYHHNFLRYNFKNSFVWQAWRGNLHRIQDKLFISSPFDLSLSLFPENRFPSKFIVRKENRTLENSPRQGRAQYSSLSYGFTQGLAIPSFPSLSFSYLRESKRNTTYKINSKYSFKKYNAFSMNYYRYVPENRVFNENFNFLYRYSRNNFTAQNSFNYSYRKNYPGISNKFTIDKYSDNKSRYNFGITYLKNNIVSMSTINGKVLKIFSPRISSISDAFFGYYDYEPENVFSEKLSQNFYFSFLNFPQSLTVSPYISVFLNQADYGNGWGWTLGHRVIYTRRNILGFVSRTSEGVSYTSYKDSWAYVNRGKINWNISEQISYERKNYELLALISYYQDISKGREIESKGEMYYLRFIFQTKEFPFKLEYVNKLSKGQGLSNRHEYIDIYFALPWRVVYKMLTINEKFVYRGKKVENVLKIGIFRNFGGLTFSAGMDYIYLLYPKNETDFIFRFFVKRKFRII